MAGTLSTAYTQPERLDEARELRLNARKKQLELLDRRQRYVQQGYDEAEQLKHEERMYKERNPTMGVLGGAAAGSKFGVPGAIVGAVAGLGGGMAKFGKSLKAQAQDEGRGKGWMAKKTINKFLNPVKHMEDLGQAFQRNPKGVTDAVGTLALNTRSKADLGRARAGKLRLDNEITSDPMYDSAVLKERALRAIDTGLKEPGDFSYGGKPMELEGVPRVLKASWSK